MKASTVYLRAAKLVDRFDDTPSCGAIYCVSNSFLVYAKSRTPYCELFTPSPSTNHNFIWGDRWGNNKKQCRVLALLFMSEIAKDSE
jgi:hypothetical protein